MIDYHGARGHPRGGVKRGPGRSRPAGHWRWVGQGPRTLDDQPGHSTTNPADMTVVGNNRADKAAGRGQEGKTCGELEIANYMRWELGR